MSYKFLFDECLWPDLLQIAVDAGHFESSCVRDRGRLGMKDHELIQYIVEHDFTFVTHNAKDFRGEGAGAPGGLHAQQPIHAGLICLSGERADGTLTRELQAEMFSFALAKLAQREDLINHVLEVVEVADDAIRIDIYRLPDKEL